MTTEPNPYAASEARLGESLVYAGFWIRVWASLIDSILVAMIAGPVLVWAYGWGYFTKTEAIAGPIDVLSNYVLPSIAVILFWIYRAATPGKMAVSARIVDAQTGLPISTGQSIGRYLGYFVSTIPLGLGLLWVGIDPRKQGWHDKLAGTVVIRHQRTDSVHFSNPDDDV